MTKLDALLVEDVPQTLDVLVVAKDAQSAEEIVGALDETFRVRAVHDVATAIVKIRDRCPDVLVVDNELPPYGTELLLSVVSKLHPSMRRVLLALLPDHLIVELREQRLVHEVVPPDASEQARLIAAVRGAIQVKRSVPELDQHCVDLFSRLSDIGREAAQRVESAGRAASGLDWTAIRLEAADRLRSMASHALALAEELEQVTFVQCPACTGRGGGCPECRGQRELLRVRGAGGRKHEA